MVTLLVALATAGVTAVPSAALLAHRSPTAVPAPAGARTAVPASTDADAEARTACGAEPRDAAGWSRLFASARGAWAGADGASSTRLPDGRLLWVFGDTFTGSVGADGVRGGDAGMVRNSIVVTDGTCWSSVSPGRDALPGRDGTWLWPTHAVVVRRGDPAQVIVAAQRLARDPRDALGFARVGAALVTVSVPAHGAPSVGAVTDLPRSDFLWGAALAGSGRTVWIYGTRPHPGSTGRDLLLARAPLARLADVPSWSYRTRTGWSPRSADAAVVLDAGVSTVLAARSTPRGVLLVTKPGEFLDPDVVALTARSPWGPWRSRTLFRAPSTTDELAYAPGLVVGSRAGHDVVVVSRTSPSLAVMMRDAAAALPAFRDVGRLGP